MKNKYQHVIDVLKGTEITTVSKPRSNWRFKVYPSPRIWLTKEALATKWISNKVKKLRNERK